MQIRNIIPEKDLDKTLMIWNGVCKAGGFYKPFEKAAFQQHLFENPVFIENCAFIAEADGIPVGFACGYTRREDIADPSKPGYCNTVAVLPEYRNKGVGEALLSAVEEYFRSVGKKSVKCVYVNSVPWPWYIPGTDGHDHPCAPALPVNSDEYLFFLHNGYAVNGFMDAFHLPLSEYEMPEKVKAKMKENEERGYKIEFYREGYHYGLEEFYKNINHPSFEGAIRANLNKEKPDPFLVVSYNGRVMGWTGAMYTEPSGRAHFDGITVDPQVRGRGLGKALFCTLCEKSKEFGSKFMTFYTGLDNPARYIYLSAGFKIAQTFAMMKKEL